MIDWIWVFLDTPSVAARSTWDFWAEVTGTHVADVRGEDSEFATLAPSQGDAWVKLQAVGDAISRVHLDLDSADPAALATRAIALGATDRADHDGYITLHSPAGLVWCATPTSDPPPRPSKAPATTPTIEQLCVDVPHAQYADEVAFWSSLTGWSARSVAPEYTKLEVPGDLPIRILVQRLGEEDERETASAHLDLSCGHRRDEVRRLLAMGARHVRDDPEGWTVMEAPDGQTFCVVERSS